MYCAASPIVTLSPYHGIGTCSSFYILNHVFLIIEYP